MNKVVREGLIEQVTVQQRPRRMRKQVMELSGRKSSHAEGSAGARRRTTIVPGRGYEKQLLLCQSGGFV